MTNREVIQMLDAHKEILGLPQVPLSLLVPICKNLDILIDAFNILSAKLNKLGSDEEKNAVLDQENEVHLYHVNPSLDFMVDMGHCQNIHIFIKYLIQ